MALPSSGQLTMTAIYNELVNGGCCEGGSYSLRDLSACAGFSSPDAMSEFYGYTCAYAIAIDAKYISSPFNETTSNYAVYYNLNYGADTIVDDGSAITTTCSTIGTIYVPLGVDFQLGFGSIGLKVSGRQFDVADASDCPATSTTYCGTVDSGQGQYYTDTPGADGKRYITIAVFIKTGVFLTCI